MAKIVARGGKNPGWGYVIPPDKTRVVFGRRSANEVPVQDPKSSRDHAELLCHGDRIVLRDLKSRNGTLLNDVRVGADQELEFGDRIQIGDAVYELVDDRASEPIGIQIPGYDILERIGQGGMGTVFRARQLSMDRIVALKVLNEKYSKDDQFIQRFIREARAAGKLSHPNVIHVHDVSQANGVHYFSMEYVDGTSLKRLIKREGRVPVEKAVDIILQAARAIEYAHQNGIIHRDIKPDNLMITKDGVVKLADLGIAKTFDESSSNVAAKRRRVYGTPHYMAPEQALGKEIDVRADVYSLGATFYHVLTGDTPFKGDTVTDVLKAHVQSNLPAVHEKAPDVPDSYVFIVERMMAKNVDKRYASMSVLIEDLEKARSSREAEIQRLSAGESSIQPAAKRKKRKKKSPSDGEEPSELPAWAKPAIAAGVVIGLVVLFFVTVNVARSFLEPDAGAADLWAQAHQYRQAGQREEAVRIAREIVETYPDSIHAGYARTFIGGQEPADPDQPPPVEEKPEEALKRLEGMAAAGEHAKVVDEAAKFAARFGKREDLVGKATALADRAAAAIAEAREAEAERAFAECDQFALANANDLEGQARRFDAVAKGFENTSAAGKAARRAAEIQEALQLKRSDQSRTEFLAAVTRADAARAGGDYDSALQAYRMFVAQHGSSPEAAGARESIVKLEKEIETAYGEATAASEKYFASASYGEARSVLERFAKNYLSAKWHDQAQKKLEDIDRRIEALFRKESQKAQADAIAFSHDDAAGQYRLLAARYTGTRWSEYAKTRAAEIDAEKALHQELVKRINEVAKGGGREFPLIPPGIPENMAQMKWRVVSASDRSLTLAAGRDDMFQRPVPWGSWNAEKLMSIFDLYFKTPTSDQRAALSFYCMERNLTDRAQQYLDGPAN